MSRHHLSSIIFLASGISFAAAVSGADGASTLVWKSQGVDVIVNENTAMADGSTAQNIKTKGVDTLIDGDMKGQSAGSECIGFGLVTVDGVYSGRARCTVTFSAEDGFTFDYQDNAEGGDWVVVGGKGKFKGATGKGHTTYTWGDTVFGDKITTTADGTINLM